MLKERLQKSLLVTCLRALLGLLLLPWIILYSGLLRKARRLIWTPIPIINNKYWSAAMKEAGFESETLMIHYYSSINREEDYDLYFKELLPLPSWLLPGLVEMELSAYAALAHSLRFGRVLILPFSGGPLSFTPLWRLEAPLLRLFRIRTIVIPYGADLFMYAWIRDSASRHSLMLSYPHTAEQEEKVASRVSYWSKWGDIIIGGFSQEGLYRWDVPVGCYLNIDTTQWKAKSEYSESDGTTEPVRILHAPNHRGAKGSEFLLRAVDELQKEGLRVELVLLEKVQNEKIRHVMQQVDIAGDQFMGTYAMFAIEAMASGLPVLCNFEDDQRYSAFRYYSFLDECPAVSAPPENLKEVLRALVRNPALRRQLGQAGRAFVEKYHSYQAAQYLFGSVLKKLFGEGDVDLMNLFHPIKSDFNRRKPPIDHPLVRNRLPSKFLGGP